MSPPARFGRTEITLGFTDSADSGSLVVGAGPLPMTCRTTVSGGMQMKNFRCCPVRKTPAHDVRVMASPSVLLGKAGRSALRSLQ